MIERVSIWGDMTQKMYRVILEAYEKGIKEYTSKDVIEWWKDKYGEVNKDTEIKLRARVYDTGGLAYVRYCGYREGLTCHGLREENIDLLKYQLSLKSSEHRTVRIALTQAEKEAQYIDKYKAKYELPENKNVIDRLKKLDYQDLLDIKITDLPLDARVKNCLRYTCLYTIGDVFAIENEELMRIPNFGLKCLTELKHVFKLLNVEQASKECGLKLKQD